MKTIQMTIDESLLEEVDQVSRNLKTNHSAFIRRVLQLALRRHAVERLEQQHAHGYTQHPVQPGEFDVWQAEQSWEEA